MNIVTLPFDKDAMWQTVTFNAAIGGAALRLRVELRHMTYTDKWYISVYDAQSGEPYCLYVPVVASTVEINDLTKLFEYKGFGHFMCAAHIGNPTSEDPNAETFGEFSIVWGDTFEQ